MPHATHFSQLLLPGTHLHALSQAAAAHPTPLVSSATCCTPQQLRYAARCALTSPLQAHTQPMLLPAALPLTGMLTFRQL
jgi:hypothetical protein